jgi:hypothetical protein
MSADLKAYVRAFKLVAVVAYPDGRLAATLNPTGNVVEVFWVEGRRDAGFVARLAEQAGISVPEAARQLSLRCAPHAYVLERVNGSIAKLGTLVTKANGNGSMKVFNRAYQQRREAARASGHGFMSYTQAKGRLIRELYKATAGEPSPQIIARVFAER